MKQLKKIKLLPLTDLDSANLNVTDRKDYDLTEIGNDATKELMEKLYKIAESTPGVIVATKVGDKNFVNTQVKTAKDKSRVFTFPEPNPICIFYKSANEHLQNSYAIKNKIYSEDQHFDYYQHYQTFVEYFQETSEGVILLNTTFEGFSNQLLPDNIEIEIEDKKLKKSEIEWLDINTKLRVNLCLLIDIRNDLIHLKKTSKENITKYQQLFKRLVELDHVSVSDSVFTFINTMTKDYFIEDDGS